VRPITTRPTTTNDARAVERPVDAAAAVGIKQLRSKWQHGRRALVVASALEQWGSASLRCFPMCCSLRPSAPKAEAVEIDLASPAMNGGGLGGGRLTPAAVAHLAVFLLVVALHSEPTC
jgi:hypothetical protein